MKKEGYTIFATGLVQGMTLVTFPAISTIITGPNGFNFSSTDYGSLFIPQAIMSICSAALNPKLGNYFGSKLVLTFGLIANMISMGLLALSSLFIKDPNLAHIILLIATGFLGISFGLNVPTLNYLTFKIFPDDRDSHVLLLNALLGTGCTLSPLFVAGFVKLGFWWEFPTILFFVVIYLLFFIKRLDIPDCDIHSKKMKIPPLPKRAWIFAAFALLYGIVETLNGNWVAIYMKKHIESPHVVQSFALTAFWGMVTFGRVIFASTKKVFTAELTYKISPFISVLAFIITSYLPSGSDYYAVVTFGLAGLGCASLLPLTISFGSKQLQSVASCIPGLVIAFYLLGYGIGAFGVGPLEEIAHISLRHIYIIGAVIAFMLGLLSLIIIKPKKVEEKV